MFFFLFFFFLSRSVLGSIACLGNLDAHIFSTAELGENIFSVLNFFVSLLGTRLCSLSLLLLLLLFIFVCSLQWSFH